MPYTLRVPTPLEAKLNEKPESRRKAIRECFKKLRQNPRHPGLRTSKVQGRGGDVFEARASRADRVTWFYDGPIIVIENHCGHEIL